MISKKNRCWHCGNPLKTAGERVFCSEACEIAFEKAEQIACMQCDTILFTGSRRDKKFCDDVCRTKYHNKQKEFTIAEMKKIDDALKKNRKILQQFLGDESEVIIEKVKLENAGYNFTYSTHNVVSKIKQHTFIFCYNYGYRVVGSEKYKIVKSFPERIEKKLKP